MAYYVLFDTNGKFMGFSTEKKFAEELIKQRKSFQKLYLQKVKDSTLDKDMKRELHVSGGDIFDYHGTYLFEHEEDLIHGKCYDYYTKCYQSIESYTQTIPFIRFTDEEKELFSQFTKELIHMAECIQDEYYCSEDPYYQCFRVDKIAIKYLKDMYKGDKENDLSRV